MLRGYSCSTPIIGPQHHSLTNLVRDVSSQDVKALHQGQHAESLKDVCQVSEQDKDPASNTLSLPAGYLASVSTFALDKSESIRDSHSRIKMGSLDHPHMELPAHMGNCCTSLLAPDDSIDDHRIRHTLHTHYSSRHILCDSHFGKCWYER